MSGGWAPASGERPTQRPAGGRRVPRPRGRRCYLRYACGVKRRALDRVDVRTLRASAYLRFMCGTWWAKKHFRSVVSEAVYETMSATGRGCSIWKAATCTSSTPPLTPRVTSRLTVPVKPARASRMRSLAPPKTGARSIRGDGRSDRFAAEQSGCDARDRGDPTSICCVTRVGLEPSFIATLSAEDEPTGRGPTGAISI